jgi:co-chaperonin GroES (HSP10)
VFSSSVSRRRQCVARIISLSAGHADECLLHPDHSASTCSASATILIAPQLRCSPFYLPVPSSSGPRPQKTATGIFLPSSATASPLPEATVIAVGPGAPNKDGAVQPVSVQPGDRVLLPGWGGSPIKVGEEVSGIWRGRGRG